MHPDAANCEIEHLREVLPGDHDPDEQAKRIEWLETECDSLATKYDGRLKELRQCEQDRNEQAAEIERLKRFVTDCGTTNWPCENCGRGRSSKGCLHCERDQLAAELTAVKAKHDSLLQQVSEVLTDSYSYHTGDHDQLSGRMGDHWIIDYKKLSKLTGEKP